MLNINLTTTVADEPTQVATWVTDLIKAIPEHVLAGVTVRSSFETEGTDAQAEGAVESGEGEEPLDLDGQLQRLTGYWPTMAPRLLRIHGGLVELSYEPKVPDSRNSARPPSYVSYIDPVTGQNLGNTNSGTFYFMSKEVTDEIAGHEFVKAGRYASVHFDTPEKVAYILEVARKKKK